MSWISRYWYEKIKVKTLNYGTICVIGSHIWNSKQIGLFIFMQRRKVKKNIQQSLNRGYFWEGSGTWYWGQGRAFQESAIHTYCILLCKLNFYKDNFLLHVQWKNKYLQKSKAVAKQELNFYPPAYYSPLNRGKEGPQNWSFLMSLSHIINAERVQFCTLFFWSILKLISCWMCVKPLTSS